MTSCLNRISRISLRLASGVILVSLAGTLPCVARTIELTAAAIDRVAVLSEAGPRQSWAATPVAPGVFSNSRFDLNADRAVLVRYNLDVIPAGQRITHAEWVLPVDFRRPAGQTRLFVWRMLADWGPGAGHQYRRTMPGDPEPWALPGARGNSSDRATRPTAIVRPLEDSEFVVNVTQDVELWYREAAPNRGWMLAIEEPDMEMRMPVPWVPDRFRWILRITYEPRR